MNSLHKRCFSLSVALGLCISAGWLERPAAADEEVQIVAPESFEASLRAAEAARAKDPAWKPKTREVALIQVGDKNSPGAVRNYCLDPKGNLLVCVVPADSSEKPGIRVFSPEGKQLQSLPTEIAPTAIAAVGDAIFVAGGGKILKLDPAGKVLASADSPVASADVVISKEVEDMVKQMSEESKRPYKEELARMKTMLENRRSDVTGVAATGSDVFMAVPAPTDFTYRVYRFSQDLKDPKLVVEKLRGCCGQMDVQAHDGKMWIPHNARHAIENLDRDGKQLAKFGKAGKVRPADFGGCCEPKSMRVLPNGDILAAESGPPTCIKRFSPNGKFKEVVALVDGTKGDCVRVTVEASPDGQKFYMLDTTRDAIRVFAAK
jgi:hypothetical protein